MCKVHQKVPRTVEGLQLFERSKRQQLCCHCMNVDINLKQVVCAIKCLNSQILCSSTCERTFTCHAPLMANGNCKTTQTLTNTGKLSKPDGQFLYEQKYSQKYQLSANMDWKRKYHTMGLSKTKKYTLCAKLCSGMKELISRTKCSGASALY